MTHFADCAASVCVPIIEHTEIARDTMRIRFASLEMRDKAVPGQFFMLRISGCNDPLIGRAFALYDCAHADSDTPWIDVVYVVKGKLTSSLCKLRSGDEISVWGPLGNGFSTTPVDHLIMVAGGIGQTPFMALSKEALGRQAFGDLQLRSNGFARRVSLCYGARTRDYLAGIREFEQAGATLHIATDDGSLGKPRLVTEALTDLLSSSPSHESVRIVTCGPEPMMEAVAKIASQNDIPCEVSLETPMACGIGICFTCVAKIGSASDWDYKRTCVEGPVFDATSVQW